MAKQIQAIRGMNDCLPSQTPIWQKVEQTLRQVAATYGYAEIRMPVVESTDLFKRSIGEVTDIVEKEMYTFEDRNGDSLTLRPEGTASCVRAGNEHGLLYNQEQRLWYMGPMFRHERPQKGRYRQFHQFGIEVFGIADADIDAEVIMLTADLWREFGLSEHVELQLNTLGSNEERVRYREALVAYLEQQQSRLDEDSYRRMYTNPLRVLDSKNPQVQEVLQDAPRLADYLGEESTAHFAALCRYLDQAGIAYQLNDRLVRGLDYYNRTVFEWVTTDLGAQGTVCAGGRYDGLVAELGGRPTPAFGFAMGLERLVLLLETLSLTEDLRPQVDAYLVLMGETARQRGLELAKQVRELVPGLRLMTHLGGGNIKKQMKRADRIGARVALIVGEDEMANGCVSIKDLRSQADQQTLSLTEAAQILAALVD